MSLNEYEWVWKLTIFMVFLFSGVRLQNWSKLGLYLVMATVIVTAGADSRSDVQI